MGAKRGTECKDCGQTLELHSVIVNLVGFAEDPTMGHLCCFMCGCEGAIGVKPRLHLIDPVESFNRGLVSEDLAAKVDAMRYMFLLLQGRHTGKIQRWIDERSRLECGCSYNSFCDEAKRLFNKAVRGKNREQAAEDLKAHRTFQEVFQD